MSESERRTGLLLINLGTPDSPGTSDVRRYLREFLMDPRVLDMPTWRRWLMVHLLILPTRPRRSGAAYSRIWTDRGSPLLFHGRDLQGKVQQRLGSSVVVELGMRYGRPSIREALSKLKDRGVERVVVFPLYPQYSPASTGSSLEEVYAIAGEYWNVPNLQVVPPFYDHPRFIDVRAEIARPWIERERPELVFFSFHGLPERHIKKSDGSGNCLERADCCDRIGESNRCCYRAQCHATARLLADKLGVPEEQRIVCFQSRLGRTPWLRPYTDEVLIERARAGCRRAAILSPAFVADCLETLEELGLQGAESWRDNGGESLTLIPALNADDRWADTVASIASDTTPWLGESNPADVVLARGSR